MSEQEYKTYYVPAQSIWPIVGAVALFLIAVGAGNFVIESTAGKDGYGGYILTAGLVTLLVMLVGCSVTKSKSLCRASTVSNSAIHIAKV